jgi:hypothetical protein
MLIRPAARNTTSAPFVRASASTPYAIAASAACVESAAVPSYAATFAPVISKTIELRKCQRDIGAQDDRSTTSTAVAGPGAGTGVPSTALTASSAKYRPSPMMSTRTVDS